VHKSASHLSNAELTNPENCISVHTACIRGSIHINACMYISHMVKGLPDMQNLGVLSHLPDSREGQPLNIGAQTAYVLCQGLGKHVYAPLHQVTGCGPALKFQLSGTFCLWFVSLSVCAAEGLHHARKDCSSKSFRLQQVHVYNTCYHFLSVLLRVRIALTTTA